MATQPTTPPITVTAPSSPAASPITSRSDHDSGQPISPPIAPAKERSPVVRNGATNARAMAAVQQAREDLAQHLGIAIDTIELLSVRQRFKPTGVSDSPGKVIGWDIRLAAGNQAYRYQVDTNGQVHRR